MLALNLVEPQVNPDQALEMLYELCISDKLSMSKQPIITPVDCPLRTKCLDYVNFRFCFKLERTCFSNGMNFY